MPKTCTYLNSTFLSKIRAAIYTELLSVSNFNIPALAWYSFFIRAFQPEKLISEYIILHIYFKLNKTEAQRSSPHAWNTKRGLQRGGSRDMAITWRLIGSPAQNSDRSKNKTQLILVGRGKTFQEGEKTKQTNKQIQIE